MCTLAKILACADKSVSGEAGAATGPADEARARRKGRAQPGLDLSIEHISTIGE